MYPIMFAKKRLPCLLVCGAFLVFVSLSQAAVAQSLGELQDFCMHGSVEYPISKTPISQWERLNEQDLFRILAMNATVSDSLEKMNDKDESGNNRPTTQVAIDACETKYKLAVEVSMRLYPAKKYIPPDLSELVD